MSRRIICRKVCKLPEVSFFAPADSQNKDGNAVTLTVDEYEVIRLLDYRRFTQEECAVYMNIARATVQKIYTDARRKVATALVEGRPLTITGGHYRLCEGKEKSCKCGGCKKHMQDIKSEEK